MRLSGNHILKACILTGIALFTQTRPVYAQMGINDTLVHEAVVYNGDTIESKTLLAVYAHGRMNARNASAYAAWTRLRNAVSQKENCPQA